MILRIVISLILIFSASQALSAKYTFNPRGNIDSYYTDNLFRDSDNEQDDIVTTVSLGFDAGVETKTAGLDVYFDPAYRFYNDFDENNRWLIDAGLNSFLDITKNTRISLFDRFAKRDDQFSLQQINAQRRADPTIGLDPTVRQGRGEFWRNIFDIRLDNQFGADNTSFIKYNNNLLINDETDQFQGTGITGTYVRGLFDDTDDDFIGVPRDDFNAYGGTLRLIHNLNRRTSGYLEYGYSHLTYDSGSIARTSTEPGIPVIAIQEDFDVHAPQFGVEYDIEEDISLRVNGGWFWRINDITKNDDGPLINFILRKELKRGGARLEAGAGYDFAFFQAQNLGFTRFYRVGVTADYELFRRFYGDIFGAWRRSEFLDEIPQRDDDRYLAGGGFTWQPLRWMDVRLAYQLAKVDSNFNTFSYTENRFFINLTFSPELPYRALY